MQVCVSVSDIEEGLVDLSIFDVIYAADDGAVGSRLVGDKSLVTIWTAHRVGRNADLPEGVAFEIGYLMINVDDTSDPACIRRVKDLVVTILGEDAAKGDF